MRSARTLAELIQQASEKIERLTPAEALEAMGDGALLVDIRSETARRRDGIVTGSLHIPRTVLEWRVAPDSEWRNPHVADDRRLILLCDHGWSSTLAAATLVDLGYPRTGDVVGGFAAWREAGLPVAEAPPPASRGDLPGMGGPDGI
jgi:rhodanese-related sulfurtransferase